MGNEFKPEKIRLVIGLGNPGKEYAETYHNAGFSFIDFLDKTDWADTSNGTNLIYKSSTFMNDSGRFVKILLKKHGLKPEQLLVAHDDSDIALGEYKLAFGRGSAGHKGAESIIKALKTKNFWRLRIGVRNLDARRLRPNNLKPQLKAGDFVLKKISAADKKILQKTFLNVSGKMTAEN